MTPFKLFCMRILNIFMPSKLTSKLLEIKVIDSDNEDIACYPESFRAYDTASHISISEAKSSYTNPIKKSRFEIGIIVDAIHDPSRKNKINIHFINHKYDRYYETLECQEPGTVLDIDGYCISDTDTVDIKYSYKLEKFAGLKTYEFNSDELIKLYLKDGNILIGKIDTRVMYRKNPNIMSNNYLDTFEFSVFPLRKCIRDVSSVEDHCSSTIPLSHIIKLEKVSFLKTRRS